MVSVSTDCELVTAYAARGSDNAFRALVTRHVHLVYATALRQVGDAPLAEEITQNVFIALARKAPRLAGVQTLAGWLHRTTILEAKARIRAELRRGRREEIAAEAAALLPHSAAAVPAGLGASATSVGLAAGGAAHGVNLALLKLMALTKTETALICAIVAAAPLAWQWHANARVVRQQAGLNAQIAAGRRDVIGLEAQVQRVREALFRAQSDASNGVTRLAALNSQRAARSPRPVYRWDDNSPLVRLPKRFLDQVRFPATANRRGQLSEQIKEVLQLWMPVDDDYHGMNSGFAVHNFGYRFRFYQPNPGDRWLSWGLITESNQGAMSASIALDDIPEMYRVHLQDWIARSLSQPPLESNAQK